MQNEHLATYLRQFTGAESGFPFGPEALVFKVMGKMFALLSQLEEPPRITLKCDPADGANLVRHYASVVPGYYMNKNHWITISLTGELPESMIRQLAAESYELVVGKLPKKVRQTLARMREGV